MDHDPLAARLRELGWPRPAADQPAPSAGQLWRAAWGDVAMLVVVLAEPQGRRTAAVAASHEPVGDDSALVVSTKQGLSPVVWSGIRASIGLFTLDQRLGDLDDNSLGALRRAVGGQRPRLWAAISDDLDDRTLIAANLVDRLSSLAEAEWLPNKVVGEPLGSLVRQAGIAPSVLGRALGITPGEARRLMNGTRQPSDRELELITRLVGGRPAANIAFDEKLVEDLDQPKFRPRLRLYAAQKSLPDEAAVRRNVAGAVLAMAARHRQPGRRNWEALISEVLDEG